MKVLLIWDSCGDDPIKLWLVTGEAAKLAMKANGQYVNGDIPDNAAVYDLNIILGSGKINTAEFNQVTYPITVDAISVCGFIP